MLDHFGSGWQGNKQAVSVYRVGEEKRHVWEGRTYLSDILQYTEVTDTLTIEAKSLFKSTY